MTHEFWEYLQILSDSNQLVIDRPRGSLHTRFGNTAYPVDYGFLKGTNAMDSGGVDIWVGSLGEKKVVGVLCTVDLFKSDTELKILYDCTEDEIISIMMLVNTDQMRAMYIKNEH